MPSGTAVDNMYEALLRKGYSKEQAARIAQSKTGEALATGKPPKHVALANAEDDAQMIQPSSTRVTPSPGMKILKDLQAGNAKALKQLREVREKASSLPDPSTLPEFKPPATNEALKDAYKRATAKTEEAADWQKSGFDPEAAMTPEMYAEPSTQTNTKKPRAPRKKKAAPAPDTGSATGAAPAAAKPAAPAAKASTEKPNPAVEALMKLGHTQQAATQITKHRATLRGTIDPPTSLERQDWIERMNKQVGEASARQAAAPKPTTQSSENAMPFTPSKFIASHPVYKERIAAGGSPEQAAHAANLATFADHPVYQEHIARGASPGAAAAWAEADMVATARGRVWQHKHGEGWQPGRAAEDAKMVQPSSTRTTSSEDDGQLRAVTESPAPDMLEESEAAAERGRGRNLLPPGKRTY